MSGKKKYEYRELNPYWYRRFGGILRPSIECPFELRLINGMSKRAPEITVLIDRVTIGKDKDVPFDGIVYRLRIKKILNMKNV